LASKALSQDGVNALEAAVWNLERASSVSNLLAALQGKK
jgi:hypothetical protein